MINFFNRMANKAAFIIYGIKPVSIKQDEMDDEEFKQLIEQLYKRHCLSIRPERDIDNA